MTMQLIEGGNHLAERACRFASALTEVNARIVFLAGLVGARLDADGEVHHILVRGHPAFRQGALGHAAHPGGQHGLAVQRAWEELRGLMVLRCELVTRALDALGLRLTHRITSDVERGLERKGIRPGADGFELHLQMAQMLEALDLRMPAEPGLVAAPAVLATPAALGRGPGAHAAAHAAAHAPALGGALLKLDQAGAAPARS